MLCFLVEIQVNNMHFEWEVLAVVGIFRSSILLHIFVLQARMEMYLDWNECHFLLQVWVPLPSHAR